MKFVEEKLDLISRAGGFVGKILRSIFGKTSRGIVAVGVLSLFGLIVFIWGIIDGVRRKKQ
jgi:hypothetical protein